MYKLKILGSVVLVAVMILGSVAMLNGSSVQASVNRSNEYQATTTMNMGAGIHRVVATSTAIQALGSVVVASSSASTFKLWNATSTTDIASSTIAHFSASPSQGTYTFDVIITRGLILELPAGSNGSYTITWR